VKGKKKLVKEAKKEIRKETTIQKNSHDKALWGHVFVWVGLVILL